MNCKKETEKIVKFLKDEFKKAGFKKAILGISGGLDSAVVCALLVKALGSRNVYTFSLPYGQQTDIEDAKKIIVKYKVNYETINILKTVNAYSNENVYGKNSTLRLANIMARVRMIALYDESSEKNALVVGTGNKTELMLGYFTHYGDGACAMEPIGHLFKTEVKELAKYLGVPESVIEKAPSAGLWEGQTDEEELGASYEEIDKCLKVYCGFRDNRYDYLHEIEPGSYDYSLFISLAKRISKNKFKLEPPVQLEN